MEKALNHQASTPNVHYHYHYYNKGPKFARSRKYSFHDSIQNQKSDSLASSTTYQSSWKLHINPEINEIYQQVTKKKRLESKKQSQIKEREPAQSYKSYTVKRSGQTTWISRNRLSRKTEYDQPQENELNSPLFASKQQFSESVKKITIDEQTSKKLRDYEKEIARLRMVEEQCKFLRKKFLAHFQRTHNKK